MISPTPPPLPPGKTNSISPRKLILGLILAGSILAFFLILFAGGIALLREAAPMGHARATSFLGRLVRLIVHHVAHHHG